jgi:predicted nucleotidyltransferase component of viral defense system
MIPYDTVTAWGVSHPWSSREQVEQDLLLSKAICDIFNNDKLASELILRGGTALNKLILDKAHRYSEDLDFVRTAPGGIGDIMKELTNLGKEAGYTVKTKITKYPKVYWLGKAQTGIDLRLKIEINTYERSPALPIITTRHSVQSDWYASESTVRVFQNEEIAATKIRALYQRSKGRDLFDLWLLNDEVAVNREVVLDAFSSYRPDGFTGKKAIDNLLAKLQDVSFKSDIDNLITEDVRNRYNPDDAAATVIDEYLAKL